ncbi:monofunctional biosynthetic peptidoglycan transglycosylase [Ahniella affigens]|uniref:Biosynthetic peptidoglycan transglycosylase n=1 Tax=Ahniella affigens TaxID=2021234 RepID=A0A2P1PYZ7_9GAMM|nr:monofunctional biosynthetic peptidoglycan transglycosylase [Ahniella affigens]AVQ00064.1 monofunctional biosynthetic peptidoglycan transglycosylase [Ahniella affigens]
MRATKEKPKRKGWRLWLWRLLKLGLWFVGLTIVFVLTLRFVPLETSAVMLGERLDTGKWPNQTWVPLDQITPEMPIAVVAAEDQRFPEHHGFDLGAIQKAYASNQRGRARMRGASTISQQVAKNVFLWQGRSWVRKGAEAWLTLWIELLWSKRRILEVYLNVAEFGPGVYGVEAAAQQYFKRPASRLTPNQAALLAAVLPNPKKFSVAAPSAYVASRQRWIQRQTTNLGGAAYLDPILKPRAVAKVRK